MKRSFKNSFMLFLVTLALIVSALGVNPAFADDSTPPPTATDVPTATEEPVATEPPVVTEEPTATELPIATAEPVATEAPVLTEGPAATEPPVASEEPVAAEEPAATEVAAATSTEETVSVVDALAELSTDTQIVVLDEAGGVEPLSTQEAADIIQSGDPIWCPAGVTPTPGVGGCTPSFFSLQALLDYLAVDANEPTQAGVIWIAANYDSSVNDAGVNSFVLDGATAFSTMSQYDLTIQGGWSGGNNTAVDHSDPSVFNGDSLGIQNWFGNVTINDIQVMNTWNSIPHQTNIGLEVNTAGDVTVTNSNFTEYNDIALQVTSTNGSVTLNGVTTALNHSGAHITAHGDINILNSSFRNGIGRFNGGFSAISTNGSVTLNGVTTSGTWLGGYIVADGDINIMNSSVTNHLMQGMSASSAHGNIFITHSVFNDNGSEGGVVLTTPGNVVVRCSEFKRNGWHSWMFPTGNRYGLDAAGVSGSLTLSSVTFEGNFISPIPPLGPPHDYLYNGTPTIDTVDCTNAPPLAPLPGSAPTSLAAAIASSGKNPILYYRIAQTKDQLPAILGEGNLFVSAFNVILTRAGAKVRNLQIPLEFPIPEDMQVDTLAVLYWDGAMWVPVAGGEIIDGYFVITVTRPGYYVLVSQ